MVSLGLAESLFTEAKKYIPGGVNSPVRSFRSVGGYPVFVKHASGPKIFGECAKGFIDYCLSWGALILGHSHPLVTMSLQQAVREGTSFGAVTKLETELARLITEAVPSIEQVRLTNSGTEAVMSAVRVARAYTNKNKIIKFSGSYHGHVDYLLDSLGVPKDFTKHTIILPFNDIEAVKKTAKKYQKDLAAIIVEPLAANCGVILPKADFLQGLRRVADRYNIVLVFDEVITGFRLSYGGAQAFFDIKADLTCLGKIIGGGLPVGAFGGRREIMQLLAPEGGVYQAGTLSGNPIAVTAGIATLKILKEDNPYKILGKRTKQLSEEISSRAKALGIKLKVNYLGSIFSLFFSDKDVVDFATAKTQNTHFFKRFYRGLLKEGIYFSPSGFEANFLSTTHTVKDLDKTFKAVDKVLRILRG
jgi:glutamate-1-semialdehyde 2,1-aminomutase